jgi:Zn-dependent M28 family amino/carboxypeptidase
MEMLASDALSGRSSGSADSRIAATYIASELRQLGLEPLGPDGGYLQPFEIRDRRQGSSEGPRTGWNVLARLRGRDPARARDVILLSAHLDHVGVRGTGEDTIYNGADDNASGVTAVLEMAGALVRGARPSRTIVFAWFDAEEAGGAGSGHFLARPPVPLESIVANLNFEMIGRPDLTLPPATLWLTGYDRTTLGPALADRQARVVADPRPSQKFFERSDNITFARHGIIAHSLSSYGMHDDYHTPADDLSGIDFAHMTAVLNMIVEPIFWLANSSFTPDWRPGMRPRPRGVPAGASR